MTNYRCISHTLNLLATCDSAGAKNGPNYKKIYTAVMSKVNKLWSLPFRLASNQFEKY